MMRSLLAEGRLLLAAGSEGKGDKGSSPAPKTKRKRRKKSSKGKDLNIHTLARSLARKYVQKAKQKDREEKRREVPKGDVLLSPSGSPSRPNQTPATTGWIGDR